MKLSIIIPCKNEEGNIIELHSKICDTLKKIKYEIIFIDDGSTDKTLDKLNEIYKKDKEHVRIISFSRNFKKESAMYAGCEHATGEYTCIMDGDMQQNPRYLLEMIDFLDNNEDYDEVAMMVKERTNESKIMRFCKKIFYKFIDSISDVHFESNASDFRMFRENVRKSIVGLKEKNRFIKGIFSWVGFKIKYVDYEIEPRKSGKTSFGFKGYLSYAIDGITDFSIKPLKISFVFGIILLFITFIYFIIFVLSPFTFNGFLILILLFLFSVQFIFIGIVATYIAKIHLEVKNRPIYISKEEKGFEKHE